MKMSTRKAFLLRADPDVLAAVQRWADEDLRSLNGQIEFLLRQALTQNGRLHAKAEGTPAPPEPEAEAEPGPVTS